MYLSEQSEVEAYLEFFHNKLLKVQLTLHIKMTILHRSAPKMLKSLHVFSKSNLYNAFSTISSIFSRISGYKRFLKLWEAKGKGLGNNLKVLSEYYSVLSPEKPEWKLFGIGCSLKPFLYYKKHNKDQQHKFY